VAVVVGWEAEGLTLTVENRDAGGRATGAPNGQARAGYGLTGMRERAELLGGELVAGATESGFRVRLWLPA
jgi:signal transduction histidine kinase